MNVKLSAVCLLALLTGCVTTTGNAPDNRSSAVQSGVTKSNKADSYANRASAQFIADQLWNAGLSEQQILEATELEDLWLRIQQQLTFKVPQTRPIVEQRNAYTDHPAFLDRIATRAQPFLFFIVEELEKRNMPLELALLPIVESAFDPSAVSHARAAGMWQFMPATGKRFGLEQNNWYDGRLDVVQSTRAALDYLQYLYNTLEYDWLNAIAAYNAGEGRIMRAIQANKRRRLPTDFWSLDLPAETTAYVPKLLALVDILQRPDEFNIVWKFIANEPKIAVLEVGHQFDLTVAADLAGMSLADLQALNPGYRQWATAPGGPHQLVVPLDRAEHLSAQLSSITPDKLMQWQPYEVQRGDTLGVIARRYQISVADLQQLNQLKGNTIRIGQTLLIPRNNASTPQQTLTTQTAAPSREQKKVVHQVKRGDTLWDLSRQYDVTLTQLRSWNQLGQNTVLREGQQLTIYRQDNEGLSQATRTLSYRVRPGDSLARIAQRFNITVADIVKWNNINLERHIQPGQQLTLLVAADNV